MKYPCTSWAARTDRLMHLTSSFAFSDQTQSEITKIASEVMVVGSKRLRKLLALCVDA